MRKALLTLFLWVAAPIFAQTPHSVQLTWDDTNNPPGTSYNVYRLSGVCPATVVPNSFSKVNSALITALTFTDSPIALGPFCYYVTATNGTLESAPSTSVATTVVPFVVTITVVVAK